jgi:bidirectional [NiFe] hydrogenase diaphorase subunit
MQIEKEYGVKPGETTKEDKLLSVLTARCIGSCGLAAAAVFDGEVAGKINRPTGFPTHQEGGGP